MKNQQVVAAGILLAVVVWMIIPRSSNSTEEGASAPAPTVAAMAEGQVADQNPGDFIVRAARIRPVSYTEQIRVRGRTQAYRHVEVRAEEAGRIVNDPVPRGTRVSAGDVLCEIAVDNRDADLLEARSRREQAQFEYTAALDLQSRSLQSDVIVAQLKAAVDAAEADVKRAELALEKTRIVAPFDGVVETRQVEVGDLLNVGAVCASVLDDSPMLLVGLVPEQSIGRLELGAHVNAELVSGERLTGRVTYLSRAADPISRSYRIEVEADDGQGTIRDGITAELMVETAQILAHQVPSSALTLNDNGNIGVKLLDDENRVVFQTVEIIGDNTNQMNPGVWVTGLQGEVTLITIGQEIVFPGQTVQANFDWSSELQARQ